MNSTSYRLVPAQSQVSEEESLGTEAFINSPLSTTADDQTEKLWYKKGSKQLSEKTAHWSGGKKVQVNED